MALADGQRLYRRRNVVIGYCGIEIRERGSPTGMIRCSRLAASVRCLVRRDPRAEPTAASRATSATPRASTSHSRGFNHLNMDIGDDDLFIQTIATSDERQRRHESGRATDAPGAIRRTGLVARGAARRYAYAFRLLSRPRIRTGRYVRSSRAACCSSRYRQRPRSCCFPRLVDRPFRYSLLLHTPAARWS